MPYVQWNELRTNCCMIVTKFMDGQCPDDQQTGDRMPGCSCKRKLKVTVKIATQRQQM